MAIMNNFPSGGSGGLSELSLSDLYSAVTENGQSGMVLIENENLSGGSFVLPYSMSVDVADPANSVIYIPSSSVMVGIVASAVMDLICINDVTTKETYVEIFPGSNIENFSNGWSARYFILDL